MRAQLDVPHTRWSPLNNLNLNMGKSRVWKNPRVCWPSAQILDELIVRICLQIFAAQILYLIMLPLSKCGIYSLKGVLEISMAIKKYSHSNLDWESFKNLVYSFLQATLFMKGESSKPVKWSDFNEAKKHEAKLRVKISIWHTKLKTFFQPFWAELACMRVINKIKAALF